MPDKEELPRPSVPTGCSSSEESDTWTRARGAQTKTPSLEEEVLVEDEEPAKGSKRERAEEPRGEGPARKRSELSAEERARDNWEARQKKRSRKAEWTWSDRHGGWTRQGDQAKPGKGSKGPGKKGKSRGKSKPPHGGVRAVTCDYWVHAAGSEAERGDDRWEVTDGGRVLVRIHSQPRRGLYYPTSDDLRGVGRALADLDDERVTEVVGKDDRVTVLTDGWRAPGQEPVATAGDWVGSTKFLVRLPAREAVEPQASGSGSVPPTGVGEAVDEPPTRPALNANSRVADMKSRLKQLGGPIWGDKARLWERLQEYEARTKASADIERELRAREEALNRDPALGRQPVELKVPVPPSEVEKGLHELTRLPYAPWCEACVRGRGRDLPHYGLPIGEEAALRSARLRPMIYMDWFDIASSDEDGKRGEGITKALLVIDGETGYVAAIPAYTKGAEQFPHLIKMVTTFLKLMRHEQIRLRSDQEPSLRALILAVKAQWTHSVLIEESPLYSSESNGRAERAIQTVRRLGASLRVALELRLGLRLSSTHPAWSSLIRHAAWLHNRFHVKSNGRTCPEPVQERGGAFRRGCALYGAPSEESPEEVGASASEDGCYDGAWHLAGSGRGL